MRRIGKHFVKHLTPAERASRVRELENRHWSYYYSTDYSSFEKHFTKLVMENVEFVIYRHLLQKVVAVDDLNFLCNILSGRNKLRTRAGHKATVHARRMSGEMCTSLGNTLTNYLLCAYVMHTKGVSLDHFDGIFEGDDGLIGSNVELTSEDFRKCGFDIKIKAVEHACHASFCGLIFAESGQVIRDPRRFFQKFGWTGSFINAGDKVMNELLKAKSLSALYETPACPLISAAARRCLSITKQHKARFVLDQYHNKIVDEAEVDKPVAISDDTRVLFERLFNIPVSVQVKVEEQIMKGRWEQLPALIDLASRVNHEDREGYLAVRQYSAKYIFNG